MEEEGEKDDGGEGEVEAKNGNEEVGDYVAFVDEGDEREEGEDEEASKLRLQEEARDTDEGAGE
jgi:hypothetical protein